MSSLILAIAISNACVSQAETDESAHQCVCILRAMTYDYQRNVTYIYDLELKEMPPDDIEWIDVGTADWFHTLQEGMFWDVKRNCKCRTAHYTNTRFRANLTSWRVLDQDKYLKRLGFKLVDSVNGDRL